MGNSSTRASDSNDAGGSDPSPVAIPSVRFSRPAPVSTNSEDCTSSPNGSPKPGSGSKSKSMRLPGSPLGRNFVRSGSYENLKHVIRPTSTNRKSQTIDKNKDGYDDLAFIYDDIEDENEDFEFSMNNDEDDKNPVTKSKKKPVATKSWSIRRLKVPSPAAGAAGSSQEPVDPDEKEEDDEVDEEMPKMKMVPPKIPALKRESSAKDFVRNLIFTVKIPVRELLKPLTPEMALVQSVVLNHGMRRSLINDLMPIKGDYCTKVRFVAAVDQFEQTADVKEQIRLGDKIVSMFLKEKGRFALTFTSDTVKRVMEDLEYLPLARQEILEDLSLDPLLLTTVKRVEQRAKE